MSKIANISRDEYYAVIFTSIRNDGDDGYEEAANELVNAVTEIPGYLGAESVRDENGFGITISYWDSLEAISKWRENTKHKVAQEKGKAIWYESFCTRVCKIERQNLFNK